MIVDEDSAFENSTDVTHLLVYYFNISMESTVSDASGINGNNEQHNKRIYNMVRSGVLDSSHH